MARAKIRKTLIGLLVSLLPAGTLAFSADDQTDRNTLRGVKTVCIVIEVENPQGWKTGLNREVLQTETERRLTQAGIPVNKDATQCVYVNARALPARGRNRKPVGLYAVNFTVQFFQTVSLSRDPSIKTFAPTWGIENLATIPAGDLAKESQDIAGDLVEKFIAAYRSVN